MAQGWTHKDLDVWQKALALAESVYKVTQSFPESERFGLTTQMRRAGVSILSNVAEGAARSTRREFLQFLHIARGSLAELDAQTTLAVRLRLLGDSDQLQRQITSVGQLLTGLIAKLKRG